MGPIWVGMEPMVVVSMKGILVFVEGIVSIGCFEEILSTLKPIPIV